MEKSETQKWSEMIVQLIGSLVERIDGVSEQINHIVRRREATQATRDRHLRYLISRGGRCPITGVVLVGPDGLLLQCANLDHYFHPCRNKVGETWFVHASVNLRAAHDAAYRASLHVRFLAYQEGLSDYERNAQSALAFGRTTAA